MDDAERLAAREEAQAGVRSGSAFDCFLLAFDDGIGDIGHKRKEAGGKEKNGERAKSDDDDDGPVPPPETVEAACWPRDIRSGLCDAVSTGDAPTVRRILRFLTRVYEGQANAREKIHGPYGSYTPLARAARSCRPELVRAFRGLISGPYLDEPIAFDLDLPPVAFAAISGEFVRGDDAGGDMAPRLSATIDALLDLGCSLDAPLGQDHPWSPGGTALHAACQHVDDEDDPWLDKEEYDAHEILLDAGLRGLLWRHGPDGAAASVLRPGLDLDARDDNGITPLMEAVRRRRYNAACMLLEAGADARAVTNSGRSAADLAIGVLSELDEAGAPEAETTEWGRFLAVLLRAGAPVRLHAGLLPEHLLPALRATDPPARELERRRSARQRTLGQEDVAGLAMDALELREAAAAEEAARARLRALEEELGETTTTTSEETEEEEDEEENGSDSDGG
jgi:hypothetical protein